MTEKSAKEVSEKSKKQLELEKLQLEIDELNIKWYKRPIYLGVLIPSLIGIISLIYALSIGFFETKFEKLEIKKEKFEIEKEYFLRKKNDVQQQIDSLTIELISYRDSLLILNNNIVSINKDYQNQINKATSEKSVTNQILVDLKTVSKNGEYLAKIDDLSIQITSLQNQYNKTLKNEKNLLQTNKQLKLKNTELTNQINSINSESSIKGFQLIGGKIIDDKSKLPISNATIKIKDRYSNKFETIILSDEGGDFRIWLDKKYLSDRATLIVTKEGYIINERSIALGIDRKNLDIRLWK